MIEFLQAYGFWIIIGLFFLAMMRMHGGGQSSGGCGMGGDHQHQSDQGCDCEEGDSDAAATKSTGCH